MSEFSCELKKIKSKSRIFLLLLTSLYYDQANNSFEIAYIDTLLFANYKRGAEGWKRYQLFIGIIDYVGYHSTDIMKNK